MAFTKRRLSKWLMDAFTIKMVTILMFFFLIFPVLKPIMDNFVKIVLVWGGIKLLYDVFTQRVFLRGKYIGWLLLFFVMEGITVAVNYRVGLKNNMSLLCYTAVALFVLYPNDPNREEIDYVREMRRLGMVYVGLCAVASLISLITFVLDYNSVLVYAKTLYYSGVFEGRLWGIYSNPNFPAAMLASALSLLLFPLCRRTARNSKTVRHQYVFLTICFILNFWYMVLAQSRGSTVSFLVFVGVYAFFLIHRKAVDKLHPVWLSMFCSALASLVIISGIGVSIPAIVKASAFLPHTFSITSSRPMDDFNEKIKSVLHQNEMEQETEIGRDEEIENSNMLTGRWTIWEQGWNKFLKNPWLGYGNAGSTRGITLHNNPREPQVKHLHNFMMQSLVSNGLAGTIPLIMYFFLSLTAMIRYVYRHRKDNGNAMIYGCIAFTALYAVHSLIEVFVLYSVSIPNFLFWIVFGYMMTMLSREQPQTKSYCILKRFSSPSA